MLNIAKGALLAFWLLALVNLAWPFAGPFLGWAALLIMLIHALEIVLLQARLQRQPQPWRARLLVLLFGVLQVRSLQS